MKKFRIYSSAIFLASILLCAVCQAQQSVIVSGYGYKTTGQLDTVRVIILACDTSHFFMQEFEPDTLQQKVHEKDTGTYARHALYGKFIKKDYGYGSRTRAAFWLPAYEVREKFVYYGDRMLQSFPDNYKHVIYLDDKKQQLSNELIVWQVVSTK